MKNGPQIVHIWYKFIYMHDVHGFSRICIVYDVLDKTTNYCPFTRLHDFCEITKIVSIFILIYN